MKNTKRSEQKYKRRQYKRQQRKQIRCDNIGGIDTAVSFWELYKAGKGMPLGVEPSQAEMIALPSSLDNFIKCQLRTAGGGHYMDDYYVLVPPDIDADEILKRIIEKAEQHRFIINRNKVKIQTLTKSFVYCKARYILTDTGQIITRGSRASKKASRKQVKTLYKLLIQDRLTFEDIWSSVSGRINYFDNYNDHEVQLKLARLFYHMFGFFLLRYRKFPL